MNTVSSSINSGRRIARFAMMCTLFAAMLAATTIVAGAQTSPTATVPYALIQDSTLTGTGNTINITQLPIVLSTGTIYADLTILFDVSSTGVLTVASGYPQQVASPEPIIGGFVAGTYSTVAGNGPANVAISGPGVSSGGSTAWALTQVSGSGCTTPNLATWYDVGTVIKNSPIYSRLKAAGITSTLFTQYGVGSGCGDYNPWGANSLLGFSQIGNALTITSYTNNGKDQNLPVATANYVQTTQ